MFFEFGIKDIIDILLVAIGLFYTYRLMKETRSLTVFMGIMMFVVVWLIVTQVLEMKLLGSILDKVVSVGVIGLVILFQDDIRKFLYNLGAHQRIKALQRLIVIGERRQNSEQIKQTIMPIVMACMSMSKKKIGALIVIQRATPLDDIVATGELIDARISQQLLENIFFKNSPLHDGAVIVSEQRIRAAGCILPVSHSLHIPKELGLRHRAALGITHESDSVAIVVSEETGSISVAVSSEFQLRLTAEKLESILTQELA